MLASLNNYLVIGGGLIGKAAATFLSENGASVSVVTRAPAPQQLGTMDWRYGRLSDPMIDALLPDQGAVIYAAGSIVPATTVDNLALALEREMLPVIELAEAAARRGTRCFVFISSGGTVYGDAAQVPTPETAPLNPISLYGTIKVMTEQALAEVGRRTGMNVVSLRVSNPYGPDQLGTRRLGFVAAAMEAAITAKPLAIWGDGQVTRDFIHISDVSRAICMATTYSGPPISVNVGSGRESSLLEICRVIGSVRGVPLEIRLEPGRPVDVRRNALDCRRASELLGWQPAIELEQGIGAMIAAKSGYQT